MEKHMNVEELKPHSLNPNIMAREDIDKLKRLIKAEGNYPPIVVNKRKTGEHVIIDGHQRLTALMELGAKSVKCDIWEIDESAELMVLTTINNLRGRDNPARKEFLLKKLAQTFDRPKLEQFTAERKESLDRIYGILEEKKARFIDTTVPDETSDTRVAFIQRLTPENYAKVLDFIGRNYKSVEDKNQIIVNIIDDLCDHASS